MTIVGARSLFAKARRQIDGPHEALLIARMVSWAWVFRVLKHSVPLPRLVRLARWRVRVRSVSADQFEQIVTLARWASRPLHRSNRGTCLERALVTYRYLTASDASPTLMVGVARGTTDADMIRGHAWVTVDGRPVDETDESLSGFECIAAFHSDRGLAWRDRV